MNFSLRLKSRWPGKRVKSFSQALRGRVNARIDNIGLRQGFRWAQQNCKVAVDSVRSNRTSLIAQECRSGIFVTTQLAQAVRAPNHRTAKNFAANFQNNTKKYNFPAKLKQVYNNVIEFPDIIGPGVAPQLACVANEVPGLLGGAAKYKGVAL